ncbi:DMT family transporter [Thermaerobacter sp. PB12/4term]|uniref:DMT family transporter n=1 Tax=Thermaerobacter sp. PB12/4term TaxID=2293838 RepID=UPI001FACD3B0|nr:EamA family transporter [Thermaerobacter sp. PB12/4term]
MDWRTLALAGCTLLFWSSAFAVIRAGLRYWGPGELALARFVVASLILALGLGLRRLARGQEPPVPATAPATTAVATGPGAAGTGRRRAHRLAHAAGGERPALPAAPGAGTGWWRDAGRFVLLGATGIFLYHTGLNWGETRVSAATASLLVATAPALTALMSRFWLGERLAPRGWLGLVLSFAGVALISWAAAQPAAAPAEPAAAVTATGGGSVPSLPAWAGPAAVGVAALGTSAFFVLQRPLSGRYDALTLTSFYTWAGTLLLGAAFGPGLARQVAAGDLAPAAWLAAVYLGVFPSALAYWCWSAALARAPAARVASLLNLNPLLAVATAWVMLGERPTWAEWLGGAVAVAGVLLVQGRPRPRAAGARSRGLPVPEG